MIKQRLSLFAGALIASLFVAACGSSGNDTPVVMPPPPPPPPPAPTSYNQFVVDQFAATADDTDPVAVDDEDFAFDEDPAAFDSLLQ